jgi:hypothetical protein
MGNSRLSARGLAGNSVPGIGGEKVKAKTDLMLLITLNQLILSTKLQGFKSPSNKGL